MAETYVSNDPASTTEYGRVYPMYVEGDTESPITFTIQENTGGLSKVVLAVLSGEGITDYLNTSKVIQCESGTNGTNTVTAVDASASGGSKKQTTMGTTTMVNRVSLTLSSGLAGLRGRTFEVHVRANTISATNAQLR